VIMSALSLLILTVFRSDVAGIAVDNDVVIDWSQVDQTVRPEIVGAPRLVSDWSSLKITVTLLEEITLGPGSELQVSLYPADLCPKQVSDPAAAAPICPVVATLVFTQTDSEMTYSLTQFRTRAGHRIEVGQLPPGDILPPTPGIISISGRLHAGNVGNAKPMVRITVSGDGDPIIIDRVGDYDHFEPGDVADIPTRSIELTRALSQIEGSLFPAQAVELDAAGSRGAGLAVGWTHAFSLERVGAHLENLKDAILTFRLSGPNPCNSNDFVLLDRAVRRAANSQRPRLPLIFFRDLQRHAPNSGCPAGGITGDEFHLHIDLRSVPIRFLSPDGQVSPALEILDLTEDLEDGQVNVIVVGRSQVDFSDLGFTLNE
jgi:hypothetical protein